MKKTIEFTGLEVNNDYADGDSFAFVNRAGLLIPRFYFPVDGPARVHYKFIEVVVNAPTTILFINGKKCVAKCRDEEFNVTKGVLVCITKYLGVTYSRIKSILKSRGLANSQDAELCLLWDIAERGEFDFDVIKRIEARIEKNSNNLNR